MKIVMRVNLGSIDAKAHGLDHSKLQQGMEADVSKGAAEWLIKEGHAVPASKVVKEPDPPAPVVNVAAVAPRPAVRGIPQVADDVKADKPSDDEGDEGEGDDESPVHDIPANEAIDKISRMRTKERLEHIANNDQRPTVKAAAEKRLGEIDQ
jgi:hypothetical protein